MNENETLSPKQLWLLNYKNPLLARFGREFFRALPKVPGVYTMRGENGEILYVGKAKVLKARLMSYTRATSDNSSRKVLRLLHLVRKIDVERLADEQSALLRENQLLRTHRPHFNVVNTSPHTYLFFHLQAEEEGVRSHLAMSRDARYEHVYGSFKGLGLVYRAHKALLRLFWIAFHPCRNGFELPAQLTNHRKLVHHLLTWPESTTPKERTELFRKLRRFLKGTSDQFLSDLCERILVREDMAPFMNRSIQDDLETLKEFYGRCAQRNQKIKRTFKRDTHLMPQNELDDYLVKLNKK